MQLLTSRVASFSLSLVVMLALLFSPLSRVFAADAANSLLPVQKWQTANGVSVYFIATDDLPILDVRLLITAGSARDGKAHGLAMLTNSLLLEGSKQNSAEVLKQQADQLGSQFGTLVGRQMAEVDMRCLTAANYLMPSINSMHQQISQPAFTSAAIGRVKNRMSAALLDYQQDPAEVAINVMMQQLYRHKPYAHQPLGNVNSIKSITRDQVVNFYKKYYVAKNMKLLLVGDLTNKAAHRLAKKLVKGISAGKSAKPLPLAKVTRRRAKKVSFAVTQTHVLFSQLGVTYHEQGFLPLQVANYSLGGSGLVSRLFNQVRNKSGLVYSINSYLVPTSYRGPWVVNFQTASANAKKAINMVSNILKNYVKNGPTPAEVSAAKKALRGQQLIGLTSHRSMMEALAIIATYNLPLNYYALRLQHLALVTPAQVRTTLRKLMSPRRWSLVTVGPD